MLCSGILNPFILSLLARVRHTNTLLIADRGFPYWPQLEIVDISLVDDLPTVNQVIEALLPFSFFGQAYMAQQFRSSNTEPMISARQKLLGSIPLTFEDHDDFKKRVPGCVGLIRTGDTTQYSNIILTSA